MDISVINSEKQYQEYLERIESLKFATSNTRAGDELEMLLTMVQLYERSAQ